MNIQFKRTGISGYMPPVDSLNEGELYLQLYNKWLVTKGSDGALYYTAFTTMAGTSAAIISLVNGSASNPPITAGSTVIIAGTGFGASRGASVVNFNEVAATIVSWSNSSITCTAPLGLSTGNVVVVMGSTSSNAVPYQVFTSSVIWINTSTGMSPASGHVGDTVTITGQGFGTSTTQYGVTVGNVLFNGTSSPASITSWTDNQIVCTVPSGTVTGTVTVTNSRGQSASAGTFSVVAASGYSGVDTAYNVGTKAIFTCTQEVQVGGFALGAGPTSVYSVSDAMTLQLSTMLPISQTRCIGCSVPTGIYLVGGYTQSAMGVYNPGTSAYTGGVYETQTKISKITADGGLISATQTSVTIDPPSESGSSATLSSDAYIAGVSIDNRHVYLKDPLQHIIKVNETSYNILSNKLSTAYWNAAAVSMNSAVFYIGGIITEAVKVIDKYTISDGISILSAALPTADKGLAAGYLNSDAYAIGTMIGGFEDRHYECKVYKLTYDGSTCTVQTTLTGPQTTGTTGYQTPCATVSDGILFNDYDIIQKLTSDLSLSPYYAILTEYGISGYSGSSGISGVSGHDISHYANIYYQGAGGFLA